MRKYLLALLLVPCLSCSDNNETIKDSGPKKDTTPVQVDKGAIDQKIVPDFCGPEPKCSGSQQACPNPVCPACVELGSDEHCSGCNDQCNVAHGYGCKSGKCECDAGLTECLGVCVDIDKDDSNCGECGNKCKVAGGWTCVLGTCKCTGTACRDAGVDAGPDDLSLDAVDDLSLDSAADVSADVLVDSSDDTSADAEND